MLTSIRTLYLWLRHAFAGGCYAGDTLSQACSTLENCVAIPPLNSGNKRAIMYIEHRSNINLILAGVTCLASGDQGSFRTSIDKHTRHKNQIINVLIRHFQSSALKRG